MYLSVIFDAIRETESKLQLLIGLLLIMYVQKTEHFRLRARERMETVMAKPEPADHQKFAKTGTQASKLSI